MPQRRSASECRALVPALSPALRGGIEVPGDHQVDNRALLDALRATPAAPPASPSSRAPWPLSEPGPSSSWRTAAASRRTTSSWRPGTGLPAIAGLDDAGLPAVRPVKGHILRLGPGDRPAGGAAPLLTRTVRGLVRGRSVYLVPRRDGSLVVGATVEERGVDTTVQAGAVHELLCDARAIVPGIDELELLEAAAGLRPATPDNMPRIGWTGLDGVVAAVGHYRNGILLAPLTAAAVVDLVGRRPVAPLIEALAPA